MDYDEQPPPLPKRRGQKQQGNQNQQQGGSILDDQPETTIVQDMILEQCKITFKRLLRIDGQVTGSIKSQGDLIIGRGGVYVGDCIGMNEVIVDGRVVGNIQVEKIMLRNDAQVHGDITAKSITMEPGTMVVGRLNINPFAPEKVNNEGEPEVAGA